MNDYEITYVNEKEWCEEESALPSIPEAPLAVNAIEQLITATDDDTLQYEVEESDGSTELFDTSGPSTNTPILDEVTQAKAKAAGQRIAHRIIKMQKRKVMLDERRTNRTKKSRKHRDAAKASRKHNRSK